MAMEAFLYGYKAKALYPALIKFFCFSIGKSKYFEFMLSLLIDLNGQWINFIVNPLTVFEKTIDVII